MEQFHLELLSNREVARWFQLLHDLENAPVISAKVLGEGVGVTYRTVNSDMVKIRAHFDQSISLSSSRLGYQLKIEDRESYHKKKKVLLLHEPLSLILDRLFVSKEVSFFDLVEDLHLSESTLMRYLKRLAGVLDSFQVELSLSPIFLKGNETDIRNFYLFYFYGIELNRVTLPLPLGISQFVTQFFQQFRENEKTTLPFLKFCYVVYLSVERSRLGFQVTYDENLLEQAKRSHMFQQLIQFNRPNNPFFISSWTEKEVAYVCLFVLMNQEGKIPCLEIPKTVHQKAIETLGKDICQEVFSNNKQFKVPMDLFLEGQVIKNSLSPTCLLMKGEVMHYAQTTYSEMYHRLYVLLENSRDYSELFPDVKLAHFTAGVTVRLSAMKNSYIDRAKEIVFLFEGNEEVCLNLKALTKRYLGVYQRVHFLTYDEFVRLSDRTIDFLVTNCEEYKEQYEEELDVLFLPQIPISKDWNELLAKINPDIVNHLPLH